MIRRALIAGILVTSFMVAAIPSKAAESIVGTWAPDPTNCTPVGGMVSIGALSLTADETACTFKDVSRAGEVVTWHGRCSDGQASRPTTVVAALRNGRLTFSMNGAPNGPYRRCGRR